MRLLEENGIHGRRMQEKSRNDLPEPGSLIPDERIDSLDMDFLNNFEVGEYVGYKVSSCDLVAASNDTRHRATEWVLFKVHQAVEKALIDAEYKRNGLQLNICAIDALASQVFQYSLSLCNLPSIVSKMKTLGVDGKKTQYPNDYPVPLVANDS
ncbi:SACS protein, partial [Polyodon spathula]|nr:SACS protein [Polyodon spathula]